MYVEKTVLQPVEGKAALDGFDRTLRQRGQERLAVALCENAIVQDDDNARIGLGSNQAADALAEFEDRLGQGKIREGISAARLDALNARFD